MDSPCPPLLSKREHYHLSQVSALCTLCSCLSTSGWWGGHPVNTYPVGTRFGTPCGLCPFSSLSTSGWWGGYPVNTYPVGTRFGTPPALCTLSSLSTSGRWGGRPMNTIWWGPALVHHLRLARLAPFYGTLAVTKVHEYLPSASDDQTSRLEMPCWAGASMRLLDQGSSPRLGLSPRYPGSAGALVWKLDQAQFILRPGWTWVV